MMKFLLSTLVTLSAALAFAAPEAYKVDTKASSVAWKGTKKVGSFHTGNLNFQEGTITVDGKNITAGNLVVDMKTMTNTDLPDKKDQAKLVGHLSSGDFFDVAKYPTASFKITSVKAGKKAGDYNVKGDLTMIGQTHPIEFPAKMTMADGKLMGEATVKIERTKWGLKYGSGNIFKELTADKVINDEIELSLKVSAAK